MHFTWPITAVSVYMTATIDSTPVSKDSCTYTFTLPGTSTGYILGSGGAPITRSGYYPLIFLDLYGFSGIGTYALSSIGNSAELVTAYGVGESSVSGTVSITFISPTLVGTFNFTTDSGTIVSNY
jgi:hypothetical protein